MYLLLNIVLYIVVAVFLVIFFKKAIEMFLLVSHQLSEKNKDNKNKEK